MGIQPEASVGRPGIRMILIAGALAFLTAAVFWPAQRKGFFDFDDPVYVTGNPAVNRGFTRDGFRKAFTILDGTSNWHPLTWLSHQADVQFFGLEPRRHHLTSLLLHAAAAGLLFLALSVMTSSIPASAAAAALWALHPLRVESVTWIAERKDVLSGFLFMTILLGYVAYLCRPTIARYLSVAGLYLLGLAAKPMLVTLPALLLLLDFWPLGRIGIPRPPSSDSAGRPGRARILAEKAPLLLLAAASTAMTLAAQRQGGALRGLDHYPFGLRAANAVTSVAAYLAKLAWPLRLSFFYPYQVRGIPPWKVAAAGILLAGATILAVRRMKRQPYFAAGWSWFLVSLLPVSGLIQVGDQAMADRYTYLPAIGICILAAWGIPAVLRRLPAGRLLTALLLGAALASLAVLTRSQIARWRDSDTLLGQALQNTRDNWLAHHNLGVLLCERGDLQGGMQHLLEAVRINPSSAGVHYNLGTALFRLGRYAEAEEQLRASLRAAPRDPITRHNLGVVLLQEGKIDEAIAELREAVGQAPWLTGARRDLDLALRRRELFGAGRRPAPP